MPETKRNLKFTKFQEFLKKNNINYFMVDELHDEAQTVIFKSNVNVSQQLLPIGIITDHTIYTIIRVQVGKGLVKKENKTAFFEYLNNLNRSYKVFKYVATDDGDIYLDSVLPSTNDSFDPEIVKLVLDVVVDHLQHEYPNIMKLAWA